jgi:group I intron endonuclease
MSDRPVQIYTLFDAFGAIRYVGKTVLCLRKRLRQHLREARSSHQCYRCNWIRGEVAAGRTISICAIESVDDCNWQSREVFWINHYRSTGCRLTNMTAGGEGLHGLTFSEEHRRKISAANLGRPISDQQKRRLSEANKGKVLTPEARRKISAAHTGRKFTLEHRAKIGAASTGRRHTAESLVRMSIAHKGYRATPETKKKLSDMRKGVPKSAAHRESLKRICQLRRRAVYQMDYNGVILKQFDSVTQAARAMGVYHHAISAAVRRPGLTCGGFAWMYCDDLKEPTLWGNLPTYVYERRGRRGGRKPRSVNAGHPCL